MKLEWLEADNWQRETLTEFTIGQTEKPHNDIATVWFDEGATVSTTREEAARLTRMFTASPDMLEALERLRDNFIRLLEQKPVRDASETLAEVDRALAKARGEP